MKVRVTLSIETEVSPSISTMQRWFDEIAPGLGITVEGLAVADVEDARRAQGICPDCGHDASDDNPDF